MKFEKEIAVLPQSQSRSFFNGAANREEAWLFYHEPSKLWFVINFYQSKAQGYDDYELALYKYNHMVDRLIYLSSPDCRNKGLTALGMM